MAIGTEKILRSVAVTLSPNEIEKIIKEYLEKEGFEVHGVDFKVSSHIEGYGMGEHEVLSLDRCVASCRVTTTRVTRDEE